jgi:ABC-type transport system involved in multi-copper enzyme maturation permease subunit
MIAAIRAELFAARRRPATWVVGGIWLALALIFGMVIPVIVYEALSGDSSSSAADRARLLDSVLPAHFVSAGVGLYPLFGSAMMLLFGTIAIGGEYRWGTLGTLLTQRPSRPATVLAKWVAVAVPSLGVVTVLFAALAAASAIVADALGRPARWPDAATIFGGLGAAWLVTLAARSLGMFLATLFRGTGAAIGVGLVWLLALENAVAQLTGLLPGLDWVRRFLIGPSAGSLAIALGAQSQSDGGIPGVVSVSRPWLAGIVLIGYVVGFTGLSVLLVRRRDVP